jgi:carboxypeptidase Taq
MRHEEQWDDGAIVARRRATRVRATSARLARVIRVTHPYVELASVFERQHHLKSAADMLEWDTAVLMPAGAADIRSAQIATLRVAAHELLVAPRTADLVAAVAEAPPQDEWERANAALMRRAHVHASAVPAVLVEARAKAAVTCETVWRGARRDADFRRLTPLLTEVLRVTREVAQAKAAALGVSPYEALVDEYEPGARIVDLDALFTRLGQELPDLVGAILERQAAEPAPQPLVGPFAVDRQAALGRELATRIGFDFSRGRFDVSTHPFCGGNPEDVRITTRFDEGDFLSSILSTVHETGHALYELGLPRAWVRQPVGKAIGMAMHESQSLIIEMQACRSPEFMTFLAPLAREHLAPADPSAVSPENLLRLVRRVQRGFIRVDADEATYPLHVILRYRLERALVDGDLAVQDLPLAWNAGMRELLGAIPPDDRLGCLQDIHWPAGAFGYFPSYTMGAVAASQLFRAATERKPEIRARLAYGDFRPLLAFLGERVHGQGSRWSTQELLERATGSPLDAGAFLDHLRRRYLEEVR